MSLSYLCFALLSFFSLLMKVRFCIVSISCPWQWTRYYKNNQTQHFKSESIPKRTLKQLFARQLKITKTPLTHITVQVNNLNFEFGWRHLYLNIRNFIKYIYTRQISLIITFVSFFCDNVNILIFLPLEKVIPAFKSGNTFINLSCQYRMHFCQLKLLHFKPLAHLMLLYWSEIWKKYLYEMKRQLFQNFTFNTWQFNSTKTIFAFSCPPQLRRRAKLLMPCCRPYLVHQNTISPFSNLHLPCEIFSCKGVKS